MEQLARLEKEIEFELEQLKEKGEKLKADIVKNPVYALEWNFLDDAVEVQLKETELQKMLDFLRREEKTGQPPKTGILEAEIGRLVERLCGNTIGSVISNDIQPGPWDQHSSSHGSNRLAVIKANVLAWKIQLFKTVLRRMSEE